MRARIGIVGVFLLAGLACNPISDWPSSSSDDKDPGAFPGSSAPRDAGASMAPREDAGSAPIAALDAAAGGASRDAGSSTCAPSQPDAQTGADAGADAASDASASDAGDGAAQLDGSNDAAPGSSDAAPGAAGSDGTVSTFVAPSSAPDAEAGAPPACL